MADTPTGPFRDARGSALVTNDMTTATDSDMDDLDPTVLLDEDGQAYQFWGNGRCYYAKLSPDLLSLAGPIRPVELPGFSEGAHLHKRNGSYYLSYGYQMPEKVAYAMSRSIDSPWEFKDILNEIAGNCHTNRPAIVDFKG